MHEKERGVPSTNRKDSSRSREIQIQSLRPRATKIRIRKGQRQARARARSQVNWLTEIEALRGMYLYASVYGEIIKALL